MSTRFLFKNSIFAVTLLFFMFSLNAKEALIHFRISWPVGWQVSDIETRKDQVGLSYLVKATKLVDGKPKAVLGIHELPIPIADKSFLDGLFDAMVKKKDSLYRKNGYQVKNEEAEIFKFKGFNAKKMRSVIKSDAQEMTQETTVILTGKQAYAITTVVLGEKTKAEKKAIKDALDSLLLQ